jgi:uncharacterized protein (TIGR03118 family)
MSKTFVRLQAQRMATLALLTFLATAPAFAQHFTRTDLTTDQASVSPTAPNLDPNLVNAWGLARSSTSPWWVSDNGTGLSTLYNATGVPQALVVKIPTPDGTGTAAPTGAVFNYTTGFQVAAGKQAIFLFVTEDGTISGWNPGVDATNAIITVNRAKKAIYKGCTLAQIHSNTFLYATNFKTGEVEVYDSAFKRVHLDFWAFRDPRIPFNFAPFNIQNVGGDLVVTFAKQQKGSGDEVDGPGLGFVSIFDAEGRLLQRLDHGRFLNAPWGIALAPSDFGVFSHRLLIGNFGDGTIHAFDLLTGSLEGTLLDSTTNQPLTVDGLWALSFGNNGTAGSAIELYFTAGPNDEGDGLLGKIVPLAAEQRGNNE